MKLDRGLVFLDIEGTGVDPQKDRIVDIGLFLVMPDGTQREWGCRVNPGIPIPQEATAIHGIKDSDVQYRQPFCAIASGISRSLSGKDLAGYNIWRYDIPILDAELRRCGLKLDLDGVRVIDPQGIFFKKDPRRLEDAVRRYCGGRSHESAHAALADAKAACDVLSGQLAEYPELANMDMDRLAEFSRMSDFRPADTAGKCYYDAEGKLRWSFGKYRGCEVLADIGYAEWVVSRDFADSTKEVVRKALDSAYEGNPA